MEQKTLTNGNNQQKSNYLQENYSAWSETNEVEPDHNKWERVNDVISWLLDSVDDSMSNNMTCAFAWSELQYRFSAINELLTSTYLHQQTQAGL